MILLPQCDAGCARGVADRWRSAPRPVASGRPGPLRGQARRAQLCARSVLRRMTPAAQAANPSGQSAWMPKPMTSRPAIHRAQSRSAIRAAAPASRAIPSRLGRVPTPNASLSSSHLEHESLFRVNPVCFQSPFCSEDSGDRDAVEKKLGGDQDRGPPASSVAEPAGQSPARSPGLRATAPTRPCPASGNSVDACFPVAIVRGQIARGGSNTQNPEHCIDKQAVIFCNPAPDASTSGQQGLQ